MILCHLAALTAVVNTCHDFSSENGNKKEKCWHLGISQLTFDYCEETDTYDVSGTNENYFSISSKVLHKKGWEPSQNCHWLATGCLGGQCLNQPLAPYSVWMAATRMLWIKLFLAPVKLKYCSLAICEWGNDKINKHMEWLSLPQYLQTGPNSLLLPSGIQASISIYSRNGEWSWAPQSWAAEHFF